MVITGLLRMRPVPRDEGEGALRTSSSGVNPSADPSATLPNAVDSIGGANSGGSCMAGTGFNWKCKSRRFRRLRNDEHEDMPTQGRTGAAPGAGANGEVVAEIDMAPLKQSGAGTDRHVLTNEMED